MFICSPKSETLFMLDWQFKIPMRVFLKWDDVWVIHATFLTITNIINKLLQNNKLYKRLFQTQGPYVTYRNFLNTMLHSTLAKETINKI